MSKILPFKSRMRAASDWFARLRSRPVDKAADAGFARWLAADPKHERQYERRELAWELAGELQNDPEIKALISEAEQAEARAANRNRRVRLWSAAAAAVVVCIAVVGGWLLMGPGSEMRYGTQVGEQRAVILPDQSRMMLNTATRVRVQYQDARRVIHLQQGEATFEVTHDPARPFEVHAHNGIARALGTQFNVLASAHNVVVSVLSGSVKVVAPFAGADTDTSGTTVLKGGEAVTYSARDLSEIRQADRARIEAWHARRVHFSDATLEEALAEFNRYTPVPIVIGDPALANLHLSGSFRAGESQAFLLTLEQGLRLRAEPRGDSVVLLPDQTNGRR